MSESVNLATCTLSSIEQIIDSSEGLIRRYESEFGIVGNSLKVQLIFHLYKHSESDLIQDGSVNLDLVEDEIRFLLGSMETNIAQYNQCLEMTLPSQGESKVVKRGGLLFEHGISEREIHFGEVDPGLGDLIQEKFHYIGHPRSDTLFHFGLFREGAEVPFAYVAFSELDRDYLLDVPYLENFPNKRVLVKTRAFGFDKCPKNSMSLLYSQAANYFNREGLYNLVVTAINQNLLFTARSFLGASYFPFATSPLEFQYLDGFYVTRRQVKTELGTDNVDDLINNPRYQVANLKPSPIIWFLKGIRKFERKKIEVDFKKGELPLFVVSKENYGNH